MLLELGEEAARPLCSDPELLKSAVADAMTALMSHGVSELRQSLVVCEDEAGNSELSGILWEEADGALVTPEIPVLNRVEVYAYLRQPLSCAFSIQVWRMQDKPRALGEVSTKRPGLAIPLMQGAVRLRVVLEVPSVESAGLATEQDCDEWVMVESNADSTAPRAPEQRARPSWADKVESDSDELPELSSLCNKVTHQTRTAQNPVRPVAACRNL